jgi:hypothetical protein
MLMMIQLGRIGQQLQGRCAVAVEQEELRAGVEAALFFEVKGREGSRLLDLELGEVRRRSVVGVVQQTKREVAAEALPAAFAILEVLREEGSEMGRWSTDEAESVGQELTFGRRKDDAGKVVDAGAADECLEPAEGMRTEPAKPAIIRRYRRMCFMPLEFPAFARPAGCDCVFFLLRCCERLSDDAASVELRARWDLSPRFAFFGRCEGVLLSCDSS